MSCGRDVVVHERDTRPGATVTLDGETPAAVIVMVAATVPPVPPPPPPPDGPVPGLSSPPPHADAKQREQDDRRRRRESLSGHQKNFLEMLNPRYQSSLPVPPRASWPIVVPKPFEKFSWNTCPPARFSMPKCRG